jgi:hypothetical protein
MSSRPFWFLVAAVLVATAVTAYMVGRSDARRDSAVAERHIETTGVGARESVSVVGWNPAVALDVPTDQRVEVDSGSNAAAIVDRSEPHPMDRHTADDGSPRRFFEDASTYEQSSEYNPHGKRLTREERKALNLELSRLHSRAMLAETQLSMDVVKAIEALRSAGKLRPADSHAVTVASGALATDVRVTRDGVTAVDVYPQDVPNSAQLQAEIEALRQQGLARVKDYFSNL